MSNEMKHRKRNVAIASAALAIVLVGAGSYLFFAGSSDTSSTAPTQTVAQTVAEEDIDLSSDAGDIDWSALPTTNVTLTDESYTITEEGTYVITGDSTSGVVVNSEGNVRLALNGVSIKSTDGAAIYVEAADNTVIQLVDGSENVIEDASTRADEEIDGAIYSADDLYFTGEGSLQVTSNFADGIVSKDDLVFESGSYVIDAADDAIRGKDSVVISGGEFDITATEDGIKSSNDEDVSKGYTYIYGGTITLFVGDDAIKGEQKVIIDDGDVTIEASTEGIEAADITINGGTVDVYASDDGINASASALITTPEITINGGDVIIEVGSGDTDAIDSNGNVYINGGTVTVTAPTSSVDYDGTGEFNGGTLTVNGEELTSLPRSMMGGGMGGRRF